MTVLVTGAAGFIGGHVAKALVAHGKRVIGIDNLNAYYDVNLKRARLDWIGRGGRFTFYRIDIADRERMEQALRAHPDIDCIVHLAAQAGVRYSMIDPFSYVSSNVMGHLVLAEIARAFPGLKHFVYASSSSVYGGSENIPYHEDDRADMPLSLYAATKRAAELISYAYGHLFGVPQTGLRFFTVYGPWGRPDMAYFSFARAILAGQAITVYDGGRPRRDFTYIDDVVTAILRVLDAPPTGQEPTRVLNIGNRDDVPVSTMIEQLSEALGRKPIIEYVERPRADSPRTLANCDRIRSLTGFQPSTPLKAGIANFARWFQEWETQGALVAASVGHKP